MIYAVNLLIQASLSEQTHSLLLTCMGTNPRHSLLLLASPLIAQNAQIPETLVDATEKDALVHFQRHGHGAHHGLAQLEHLGRIDFRRSLEVRGRRRPLVLAQTRRIRRTVSFNGTVKVYSLDKPSTTRVRCYTHLMTVVEMQSKGVTYFMRALVAAMHTL